jgi:hypothetical protein
MVLRHRAGKNISMVRIQPPTPNRTLVVTWRPGRYLSTNARQFLHCVQNVARGWSAE